MAKPVVGLTGGIASGKSTAAARFVELGIPIVDADVLARDIVARGTPGLQAVIEAFGETYLDAEGELDRKKLGALVFADEEARRRLNAISHPRIAAAAASAFRDLQESSAPYLVYEAALLVENRLQGMFASLVVVAVDAGTQRARLMTRDGIDAETADSRIAAQMPLQEKIDAADFVIWNGGSVKETHEQVDAVHSALQERFA